MILNQMFDGFKGANLDCWLLYDINFSYLKAKLVHGLILLLQLLENTVLNVIQDDYFPVLLLLLYMFQMSIYV